jgi:carboxymethylenebutenolidase
MTGDATGPTRGFAAGMVDMESNTTLVQSYPAHQAVAGGAGPFPAALVLHDRLGLTSHVRHVANRLAHAGFYALAPDLYGAPSIFSVHEPDSARAPHRTYFDWSEEVEARERETALTDERALEIVEQAIVYAGGRGKAKSGGVRVLGFGTGGRLALLAGCRFPDSVRALSLFSPRDLNLPKPPGAAGAKPSPLEEADKLTAPVLLLYGKLDTTIPKESIAAAIQRLQSLGQRVHVEMLRNAGPDFFCEERDSYRIGASKIAWDETLKLFRET